VYGRDRSDFARFRIMADLTVSRSTQTPASGIAGLLGLFAGLCAVFAGCVTLSDGYDEARQARWPVVAALVDRAEVVAMARAPKDGGTLWNLRARVRFEVNGEPRTATLISRNGFSEQDAACLESWAAELRKSGQTDVRYDPSRPDRAVFALPDLSPTAGRLHTDLILLAVAAIACGSLLRLARYLRAREERAAPAADGDARAMPVLGLLVAAMGLTMAGLCIHGAISADPFAAENLIGVPIGLMFAFAGIIISLPPDQVKWRNLLATLLITCFALTFDWVAFGPGERQFTGSIMGFGFIPGEWMGRAAFGAFAIVLDICAVSMWIGQCRRGFAAPATASTI
jgi:hypothetical protein